MTGFRFTFGAPPPPLHSPSNVFVSSISLCALISPPTWNFVSKSKAQLSRINLKFKLRNEKIINFSVPVTQWLIFISFFCRALSSKTEWILIIIGFVFFNEKYRNANFSFFLYSLKFKFILAATIDNFGYYFVIHLLSKNSLYTDLAGHFEAFGQIGLITSK